MTDTVLLFPTRRRYGISLPLVAGCFFYAAALLAGRRMLLDGDTYWHITVGRWIIGHGAIPHTDLFSQGMAGAPWIPHEWLAEVLIAGIFDHFGWIGLAIVIALLAGAAMALLMRTLLRFLAPRHALIAVLSSWLLVLVHLLARPHVFTFPLLVLWTAELVNARADNRAPSLALLPVVTLWANLHGSVLFALAFGGLFALEAVIAAPSWAERWGTLRGWGLFLILSTLAALITPNGVDGLLLPLRLQGMSFALSTIVEWQSANFQSFQLLEVWLLAMLFGALSLGKRLPAMRIGMLLLLLHMALQHIRHVELIGLMAPLLIAPALSSALARRPSGADGVGLDPSFGKLAARTSPLGWGSAALLVTLCALVAARIGIERGDDSVTPATAVQTALDNHVAGPVLNEYAFGGYLIFSGIPPFIDGRADMYGDAFLRRYFRAIGGHDELPRLLRDYGIAWTLLAPDDPAVTLLDNLPGWQRLYADKIAVVHRRTAATPPSN